MSPTVMALRSNPLLRNVAVSLTPDFSVMGGKCKTNVQDSCSRVVRNHSFPLGTFYTQAYNVYTTSSPTQTDVTPWDLGSPSASCIKHKTQAACPKTCCAWLRLSPDVTVCGPKVDDASCTRPDPSLCGASGTACDPPTGHSVYAATHSPLEAAERLGAIVGNRLLQRCGPGGSSIEALTSSTLWQAFTIVFSYEYWSAPGPPLWLMGNPERVYNSTMWSEFVTEFRHQLAITLQGGAGGDLCSRAAHTLPKDVKFGVYWARRALAAWGAPSPDPIVEIPYTTN